MKLFTRKPKLQPAVIATLEPIAEHIPDDQFWVLEANSTLGVIRALEKNPSLIVVDVDGLSEYEEFGKTALIATLKTVKNDGVIVVGSKEFLESPKEFVGRSLLVDRKRDGVRYMEPRVVMFTNFSGGVGKTTFSLTTARQFRQATGLPTAAVEAGVGGSSFHSRLGGSDRVTLFDHVTQCDAPSEWHGVSVYPSDDWAADVMKSDQRLPDALDAIVKSNTLTVFDVFPTTPYWPHVLSLATHVFVVISPRPDSLVQMDAMRQRLKDDLAGLDPQPTVHLVLNQVQSAGERLAVAGMIDAWVERNDGKALGLHGDLAEPVLEIIYPGWRKQKHRRGKPSEKVEEKVL